MATQHGIPVRPDNLLIVDVQHPEPHLFRDNAILGEHIQVQLALAFHKEDHHVRKLMHKEAKLQARCILEPSNTYLKTMNHSYLSNAYIMMIPSMNDLIHKGHRP